MKYRVSEEIHRLFIRMKNKLENECPAEIADEVTGVNSRIIAFLAAHEDEAVYQKDIEKAFGITRSTASRVLALMEEKALITRAGVEHDARLKRVGLTERARKYHAQLCQWGDHLEDQLFEDFTAEEEELFHSLLMRMHDKLDRM